MVVVAGDEGRMKKVVREWVVREGGPVEQCIHVTNGGCGKQGFGGDGPVRPAAGRRHVGGAICGCRLDHFLLHQFEGYLGKKNGGILAHSPVSTKCIEFGLVSTSTLLHNL